MPNPEEEWSSSRREGAAYSNAQEPNAAKAVTSRPTRPADIPRTPSISHRTRISHTSPHVAHFFVIDVSVRQPLCLCAATQITY